MTTAGTTGGDAKHLACRLIAIQRELSSIAGERNEATKRRALQRDYEALRRAYAGCAFERSER